MVHTDTATNLSPMIVQSLERNLLAEQWHPLSLLRTRIQSFFSQYDETVQFAFFDDLSPVVSVQSNFDALLVPKDHVSRRPQDTYYVNRNTVLRTQTTAHDSELLMKKKRAFLVSGDVCRRDEIDYCHYPVFHQLDGVRVFSQEDIRKLSARKSSAPLQDSALSSEYQGEHQSPNKLVSARLIEDDLKRVLGDLAISLFGENTPIRWVKASFPFTQPSWELEVLLNQKWLEVLGCGILHDRILRDAGRSPFPLE